MKLEATEDKAGYPVLAIIGESKEEWWEIERLAEQVRDIGWYANTIVPGALDPATYRLELPIHVKPEKL